MSILYIRQAAVLQNKLGERAESNLFSMTVCMGLIKNHQAVMHSMTYSQAAAGSIGRGNCRNSHPGMFRYDRIHHAW